MELVTYIRMAYLRGECSLLVYRTLELIVGNGGKK